MFTLLFNIPILYLRNHEEAVKTVIWKVFKANLVEQYRLSSQS